MQLSPEQRRQLQKLSDYRQTPPTIPGLLRSSALVYLYISAVGLFGFGFFLWYGWRFASGLFAGLVIATILRDAGWFRRLVRSWPLQAEVTHWRRVEQLLAPADAPPESPPADARNEIVWVQSADDVDWDEMSELYRIAPLGTKSAEWLKGAYANSRYKCLAYDSRRKIVAAGRAVADGVDCSYLCDIVVHPAYQRSGLGKKLLQSLIDLSRGHRKIILYAVPGREPFYRQFGFRRMNTAMAIFEDPARAAAEGYTE